MESKAHRNTNFRTSFRQRVRGAWLLAAAVSSLFAAPAVAGATAHECDFWAQDCSGAEEKCIPNWDGEWVLKCTPTDPNPSSPGDPCVSADEYGPDSCGPNAMCDADPETGEGECVEFCTQQESGFATCEDPGTACGNWGPYGFCLPHCDPLIQGCEEGETCIPNWTDSNNAGTYICLQEGALDGEGYYGDECEYVNDCAAGLLCAPGDIVPECEGDFCCTTFCDLYEQNPCNDATLECVPTYYNPDPGEEGVGYCSVVP